MGEIAEMMLEGILCQYCGVYLDVEESCGFPMSCSDCEEEVIVNKAPKISAAERKVRKRTLKIVRDNFKFDMLENICSGVTHWECFLYTRFMDYIREAKDSKDFEKVVLKSVKQWAEINTQRLDCKRNCKKDL